MKQKMGMFVATVLAALSFSAASAQTTSNQQNNGSLSGKEQLNKQQLNKQKQMAVQKPQTAPGEKVTRLTPGTKGVAATDKKLEMMNREQLLILRKQAADKGLPNAEYDNVIKQLMINQAK